MSKRYLLPVLSLLLVLLSKCGGSSDLQIPKGRAGSGAVTAVAGEGGEAEQRGGEGGTRAGAAGGAAARGGASVNAGAPSEPAGGEAGNGGRGGTESVLVAIEITPASQSVALGTEALLSATGRHADGSIEDVTALADWTTSAIGIASVLGGRVSAVAPGSATISATLEGVTGTSLVMVPTAAVASISLTPTTASVGMRGDVAFRAVAVLTDGSTQDVTATAEWSSSETAVATVSKGTATGVAPGTALIQATAAGKTGSVTLTVTSATLESIAVTPANSVVSIGASVTFQATGTFSDETVADVSASATWTARNLDVVQFNASSHTATGVEVGSTEIVASVGNVSGSTNLAVTDAPLVGIVVTPAESIISVNGVVALSATGTYADGSSLDLTSSVTWSSSDGGVAAASNGTGASGRVQGLKAGTATITASFQGAAGAAIVTVTSAELESITLSPNNPTLPVSTSLAFTAIGTYADGSQVDLTESVGWSTADRNVATISNAKGSQGLLSATAPGTTVVTAVLGAVKGSVTVKVTAATLVSIAVTPANLTLAPGSTRAMTALGTFSDNTTADLTTSATWSSSDTAVATLSNASASRGTLSAIDVGTATVRATFDGVAGTTAVTVAVATLVELVLDPIAASVPVGQTVRYSAVAIYSDNSQSNVTGQVTWSSSDSDVAALSGGGGPGPGGGGGGALATALGTGTTTISATYRGITGTTTLTVTSATLSQIVLTPIAPTLPIGRTQQLVATAIYSDNTQQNVTGQATWQSSAANVAQVSTGAGGPGGGPGGGGAVGLVTALAAGTSTVSASWGDLTGSTTVTVTAATIASVVVNPVTASLAVGSQQQFTAQVIYSDNTSADVTQAATWLSSDDDVAGVSSAGGPGNNRGLAKALAPGAVAISASYGGVTGNAQLTVTSATLVRVELTPVEPSVAVGSSLQFVATALYSDDTSRTVTGESTWTSSNPSVAQVSTAAGSRGLTQASKGGTATINATFGGTTGATTLTVTTATLTAIELTPFEPTLLIGIPVRFVATGIYSDFTTVDLTSAVTWTSNDTTVVSVSNAGATRGQASPLSAGSATLSARYQGISGADTVTVSSASITRITVSPTTASIAAHATQGFTALATLSDTTTLDVTTYVTWLSATSSVAAISNAAGSQGTATGLSTGTTTITAVRGSVSGTAQLTVN